jgi:hypothetical protein
VEQGQGEQEVILGRPPPGRADGFGVADKVAVQQHRALAATRGPRGVGDHGQVVAAGRGRFESSCAFHESVEVVAAHHDPLERREIVAHPLELRTPLSVGHAQPHPGVLEDVSQLRPAIALVHRHRHAAGQVRAEVRCEEVRVVPEEERDAVARLQAPGPKRGGERPGAIQRPAVAPVFALEAQAKLIRRSLGVAREGLDH